LQTDYLAANLYAGGYEFQRAYVSEYI